MPEPYRDQIRVTVDDATRDGLSRVEFGLNNYRQAVGHRRIKILHPKVAALALHNYFARTDWTPDTLFNTYLNTHRIMACALKGDIYDPDLATAIAQAGMVPLCGNLTGPEPKQGLPPKG